MAPVKIISLERSTDRRAAFARGNPHLDYHFITAVDGAALAPAEIAATGLFRPGLDYTPGAYGVALSHHGMWEEAIRSSQTFTIGEDDAIFRADFHDAATQFLAELPQDWDFVLWGWNFDSIVGGRFLFGMKTVMAFEQSWNEAALQAFPSSLCRAAPMRLDFSFGLPCYSISPAGARKFKAGCFPLADFSRSFALLPQPVRNRGLDVAMTNLYPLTNAYAAFPPLVATRNDRTSSTVQTGGMIKR